MIRSAEPPPSSPAEEAAVLLRGPSRVLLSVLALTAAALWALSERDETRAILDLPPETRSAIYHRELDGIRALCSSSSIEASFAARCEDRALFLERFPECDDDCRRLVEPHLPRPTR